MFHVSTEEEVVSMHGLATASLAVDAGLEDWLEAEERLRRVEAADA